MSSARQMIRFVMDPSRPTGLSKAVLERFGDEISHEVRLEGAFLVSMVDGSLVLGGRAGEVPYFFDYDNTEELLADLPRIQHLNPGLVLQLVAAGGAHE